MPRKSLPSNHYSRAEVANILGCDAQSVTNYVKRGLLEANVSERNMYITKESLEKFRIAYFPTIRECEDIEDKIKEEHRQNVAKCRAVLERQKERLSVARTADNYLSMLRSDYLHSILEEYLLAIGEEFMGKDTAKRAVLALKVINDFAHGSSYSRVESRYKMSHRDTTRLAWRGMSIIRKSKGFIKSLREENEELKRRCERQHEAIVQYRNENELLARKVTAEEQYKSSLIGKAITVAQKTLLTNVDGYDLLSVRAMSVLERNKLYTMYDLLSFTVLGSQRNCGKITIAEILSLVNTFDAQHPDFNFFIGCFGE